MKETTGFSKKKQKNNEPQEEEEEKQLNTLSQTIDSIKINQIKSKLINILKNEKKKKEMHSITAWWAWIIQLHLENCKQRYSGK